MPVLSLISFLWCHFSAADIGDRNRFLHPPSVQMCLPLIPPVTLCVLTWLVDSSPALKKFLFYEDILFILLCPEPIFLAFWVKVQSRHLKNISLLENLSKCFSASFFVVTSSILHDRESFRWFQVSLFWAYTCVWVAYTCIYTQVHMCEQVWIYMCIEWVWEYIVYLCVLVYANVSPPRVHVALWECVVCIHVCLLIVLPWRPEAWTTQNG